MEKIDFDNSIDLIISEGRKTINKKIAAIKIIECLDLTSLDSKENKDTILKLIKSSKIENIEGVRVAGICVYPNFLSILNNNLEDSNIKKVVVAGYFPSGQNPLELKLQEIEFAIKNGAQEVDIVMNRGLFLEGKYDEVSYETFMSKRVCGDNILKVILEVGDLVEYEKIFKASQIALESGADFIKTSSGKIERGADVYSFAIMLEALKDNYSKTGIFKGIKASGGISSFDQALDYYILFKHYFGVENLYKKHFRIGGSRLKDSIIDYLNY
ncbi:MAG: 2-deoxyribose-5-phosphate aldolase [Bacteroidetes bacterium]|nr:2-deoxyribose-5-phosphate aldolase [Bacteroidota bacterium]